MKSEKGQAIVFLALGFIVFLGFVGLAIDGGMLYSDRRHAQNSSDASALAGAGTAAMALANLAYDHPEVTYTDWTCHYGSLNCENIDNYEEYAECMAINAAIARGQSNDFTLDTDLSDLTYVTTECVDTDSGVIDDAWIDVTVSISDTTTTSFAHLLYPEPLRNLVDATARAYPKAPFGYGHSLIATRDICLSNPNEGGVHFNGSNNVYLEGGGVFSNACIETSGGTGNVVEVIDGDNACIPYEYDANGYPISCFEDNGDPAFNPEAPDEGEPDDRIYPSLDPPNCTGEYRGAVKLQGSQTRTIYPGVYDEITVNGGTLYLEPGLYCVLKPSSPSIGNGNVYFNGGTIEGSKGYDLDAEDPFFTGVSFYLDKGSFATGGNATVRLTASMVGSCAGQTSGDEYYCPGIRDDGTDLTAVLVYLATDNTSDVTLVGTGDDKFTGLIFVPNGTVDLVGTGDTVSFNLQIIADTISVGGNAIVNIIYDDELQKWTSAMVELIE